MYLEELEDEGDVSPSWTGSNLDHYNKILNFRACDISESVNY